jgi:serine protease Do
MLVLVGLVIGLGLSAGFNVQRASKAERAALEAITSTTAVPESPFVGVVDKALPAVVFIDVRKKVARAGGGEDTSQDELFRRFFGDTPRRPQRVPSSGSGFVVDAQGHILTNNHVVSDAEDITVTLNDKRTFKAKVVGTDPATDVAVIKIEGARLPVLPLGDSDKIRVGDWAIAIGNPLGMLKGSVTVGIISARGRADLQIFGGTPAFQDFIQTDASINFGNSGGPLCNIRGEAIGINTAINPSGQGIGFAIPINLAKHVADQLVAHGTVKRGGLGVELGDLTPELAEGLGLDADLRGVLIQNVIDDSPAARAGLKRGDVIVEMNGQAVAEMQKFRLRVADTAVGTRIDLAVLREGKRVPVSVTLGDRSELRFAQGPGQQERQGTRDEALPAVQSGLRVRDLTSAERQQAGVKAGVMVTEVVEGSAAEDAGFTPNDIVEEVGGKAVTDPATFARLLKEASTRGRPAVLLVRRGTTSRFLPLRLAN